MKRLSHIHPVDFVAIDFETYFYYNVAGAIKRRLGTSAVKTTGVTE
jgi:hypothetical protein